MELKPTLKRRPARWTDAMRALPVISIRRPFAWLVVNGIKDIVKGAINGITHSSHLRC